MIRTRWFNYLIGGAIGLLLILLLTQSIWPMVKFFINKQSPIFYFIGINITFLPIIISIILIIKFYHKSDIKTFINPTGKLNYKRLLTGFIIWFSFQLITILYNLMLNKNYLTYNFHLSKFLYFLLLSLILTPIQVASEELLFRGYLINFLKSIKKGIIFPLLISGVLFALPHLNNPEVKNNQTIFFFLYLSMALIFGYLTLKYNGMEYSLGVHFANNFFAINVLNYPDSPLPSSPIFLLSNPVLPLPSLRETLVFGFLLIIIIKKIEKNNYQICEK